MSSGSSDDRRISTGELNAQLRDAEFFRSLVENGPDAIVTIDENSTVLYANQPVERVFGYEPEELIGEELRRPCPTAFAGTTGRRSTGISEPSSGTSTGTTSGSPPNTGTAARSPSRSPSRSTSTAAIERSRGVVRDSTEQRERQRELGRQNERLEEFAGIVSYDLRNSL